MLSSPSRTQSSQGHDDFSSSSPRLRRSVTGDVRALAQTNAATSNSTTALPVSSSESRSSWPEPYLPSKQQQSRLRMSTIPGDHGTSDEDSDGSLSSPASTYTLESLQAQRRALSLTGDKPSTISRGPTSPRPDTWYKRGNKNNAHQHIEAQKPSTIEDMIPTQVRPSSIAAPASTSASGESRSKIVSTPCPSRFSFFNMSGLRGLTATNPVSMPKDDELINMDINAALLSSEGPRNGEAFSPAAFKNLQMNATGLLRKFQSAYQDKAIACQELRAERDSQQDEKMEMETRAARLKMQLEDMAQKAAEHEIIMQALMQELNEEKRLRSQERTARESVVLSSGTSAISEDLGAEDDQRKKQYRRSAGTIKSEDAGFETDDESIDQLSVFSRSRSPPLAASPLDGLSTQSGTTAPHVPQPPRSNRLEPPRPSRQSQPQQISTFQKLMKGIAGDSIKCQNCQGQDASVAWDTASLLRDENRGLKQRVSDLEAAVEGALDAVMGVNM
ncbi:hypothetical protein E4U25_003980 [Claviceps purpurea]|nr:hypothetical protein E4U27_000690 [Claviceps purpurea]KAG6236206.1 hypothetical protein E4U25_003980 [Claviceps purpurea]